MRVLPDQTAKKQFQAESCSEDASHFELEVVALPAGSHTDIERRFTVGFRDRQFQLGQTGTMVFSELRRGFCWRAVNQAPG